ncbi:probable WRKY transcription factor 46 [Benincasa hispida]|uniref:probable WRKY transcription factor 46 n=1 Tax=Benincasa hispida TaxID=102211 RepID=UPI0019018BAB|nr:probable WRKY transcription factor 46 [Benincasa hispida]
MEIMEHKSLVSHLTQGKQLAIQLKTHFHPSSSPEQACLFLTEMIHSSFEKALNLLSSNSILPNHQIALLDEQQQQQQVEVEESSNKNKRKISSKRDVLKKRKLLPRWTEEVKVCNGTAPEGPLNDGYSWRKYGQKDIHGANFPRCYYRCTHRNVRGCLATKQVQKSDNDPNIFEVTYRGRHTCNQSSNLGSASISSQNQISEETNQIQQDSEIWFNFGENNFNLKTEDFDNVFSSFSFSHEPIVDPTFIAGGGLSAVAVSPAASNTAWDWNAYGGEDDGGLQRVQSSEQSDVTEIISATTSVTNSPICNGDWDFSLDNIDFDQNFPFDCLDFTS